MPSVVENLIVEGDESMLPIAVERRIDPEQKNAVRVESRFERFEVAESLQEQTGSDHQYE